MRKIGLESPMKKMKKFKNYSDSYTTFSVDSPKLLHERFFLFKFVVQI